MNNQKIDRAAAILSPQPQLPKLSVPQSAASQRPVTVNYNPIKVPREVTEKRRECFEKMIKSERKL